MMKTSSSATSSSEAPENTREATSQSQSQGAPAPELEDASEGQSEVTPMFDDPQLLTVVTLVSLLAWFSEYLTRSYCTC
jgi:hypothetical protein